MIAIIDVGNIKLHANNLLYFQQRRISNAWSLYLTANTAAGSSSTHLNWPSGFLSATRNIANELITRLEA